jgi:hypothetical protein
MSEDNYMRVTQGILCNLEWGIDSDESREKIEDVARTIPLCNIELWIRVWINSTDFDQLFMKSGRVANEIHRRALKASFEFSGLILW